MARLLTAAVISELCNVLIASSDSL